MREREVFICINGFYSENGSNMVAREISVLTEEPTFKIETYLVDCRDERGNDISTFEVSDQVKNACVSEKTGLVRPVPDSETFLKYYEVRNEDVEKLALLKGFSILQVGQKIHEFLEFARGRDEKVRVLTTSLEECSFVERLLSRYPNFDRLKFIQTTLYIPLEVPSMRDIPMRHLVDEDHHQIHYLNNIDCCTAARAWHFKSIIRDHNMFLQQDLITILQQTGKIPDERCTPVQENVVRNRLKYYRLHKKHRTFGWCAPIDGESVDDEDEKKKLIRYNSYCGHLILP